jgi:hypothetical protein
VWHAWLVQMWTHYINIGWIQHMNIIMQGIFSIFEDPNMKGNLKMHSKHVFFKCEHIIELFFFQNLIFLIYLKFLWQRKFKIKYLMHFRCKNYETNSKSCSFKIFPIVPIMHLDSTNLFHFDLIQFSLKKCSIFNNLCNMVLNTRRKNVANLTNFCN